MYFLVVFGFCSTTQQHLQLLNTSHIYLSYKNNQKIYEINLRFHICWSEKLNHVLKTDSDKLFKWFTDKYFLSKFWLQILRWSFAWIGTGIGIPWLKINNSNTLLCKITIYWIVLQFWAQTREQAVGKLGVKKIAK